MISFILNLPHTVIGLVGAIVSVLNKMIFLKEHHAFVIHVRYFRWAIGWMKGARAATIGHVVLLSPRTEQGDLEHELIHVRQHQEYPFIFPFLYYIELLRKGYRNNKYENEAYNEAGNRYGGSEVIK